jgi:hypothetical protein
MSQPCSSPSSWDISRFDSTVAVTDVMPIAELLARLESTERVWDTEPVFCFTSDIDWASEAVLAKCLPELCAENLKLTVFVTHESRVISELKEAGCLERGIHPNFLSGSSHGEGFRTVIETCIKFAPEAEAFRSHRLFDVTDVTHLLHDDYKFKYVSNLGTVMQPRLGPVLHESGLVHFPTFFEDGTHLFHGLSLRLADYLPRFVSPGIKIISIHPADYVINTPKISYMRGIKDSMSREAYQQMSAADVDKHEHRGVGIRSLVREIIALSKAHRIMSLSELYRMAVS